MQHDYNIMSINISSQWYKDEPFILASQAEKVFYLDDLKDDSNWKVVYKVNHRHLWDFPEQDKDVQDEVYQQNKSADLHFTCQQPDMDLITFERTDIDGETVTSQANKDDQRDDVSDDFVTDDIEEDETLADYDNAESIQSDDMDDDEEDEHIDEDNDDSE